MEAGDGLLLAPLVDLEVGRRQAAHRLAVAHHLHRHLDLDHVRRPGERLRRGRRGERQQPSERQPATPAGSACPSLAASQVSADRTRLSPRPRYQRTTWNGREFICLCPVVGIGHRHPQDVVAGGEPLGVEGGDQLVEPRDAGGRALDLDSRPAAEALPSAASTSPCTARSPLPRL